MRVAVYYVSYLDAPDFRNGAKFYSENEAKEYANSIRKKLFEDPPHLQIHIAYPIWTTMSPDEIRSQYDRAI